MNKSMYFRNPVFHTGLNITVRRGDKWSNHKGSNLDLVDLETDSVVMTGIVRETISMKYEDISNDMLASYHDPNIRNKEDLLIDLRSTYSNFESKEDVTLVCFEVFSC